MEQMLTFGKKAVNCRYIEAVSYYMNQVTIHTPNNQYTTWYDNSVQARGAYEEILAKIEARG